MKLLFAVCSEGVSVDRYTNKLSIFSVLDQVASLSFPLWIQRICLTIAVSRTSGDNAVLQGKMHMLLESSPIAEADVLLPFQADGTARVVLNFNLAIPAPGRLTFRLHIADKSFDVYQIAVSQVKPSEVPIVETAGVHQLQDVAPEKRFQGTRRTVKHASAKNSARTRVP